MKTSTVLLISALLASLVTFSTPASMQTPAGASDSKQVKRLEQVEAAKRGAAAMRRARQMLLDANVPFEPNILFSYNWKKKIAPYVNIIAAMHRNRKKTSPLNGVEIADRLTLPEKVALTGDTVILVNDLVFSGRKVEIKGPHSLFIFPIGRVGAVDNVDSTQAHHNQVQEIGPLERLSINIDAEGREEWLEKQRSQPKRSRHHGHSQNIDEPPGATGNEGNIGDPGQTPEKRDKGLPGNCATNPDGGAATFGLRAKTAGTGGLGQRGRDGNNAAVLSPKITQTTGTFSFSARGGDGGQGGRGGQGGFAAPGGAGGDGGAAAMCTCDRRSGNGGAAGDGGPGGDGGSGGTGGNGGTGGRGGIITVTTPCNFAGTIIMNFNGGLPGPPGEGGRTSPGGPGGAPGATARGAVNPSCSSLGGSDGQGGSSGPPGDNGFTHGDPGQVGTTLGEGRGNIVSAPGCGSGEQDVLEPSGFNSNDYCTDFYWVHYSCDCLLAKQQSENKFLNAFWGGEVTRPNLLEECSCEQVGSPIYAGCF